MSQPPSLIIIAGANGAGKSTLTASDYNLFILIPVFDPDLIANAIQPVSGASSQITAGRQVLASVAKCLEDRKSLAVETTLSGKNYLQVMRKTRAIGFEVLLVYIGTTDVEINLERITGRVLEGGHSVPEPDVRRRYQRSLQNLPLAVQYADHTILFDNSTAEGYQLVGIIGQDSMFWADVIPAWASSLQNISR